MNTNPTLVHGQAMAWLDKSLPEPLEGYQRQRVELRIYEAHGSGYYFIRGAGPGKWYHSPAAGADHFTNCDISQVEQCISEGVRVQIVGDRSVSYGVWPSWEKFAEEVLCG